jgi:hypothetical protein
MSEKHLYEKHLAEKLQQLSPPPDMEQHWQEMKALLDDDRPRGGGFGKRWWRIGVLAGILLIGTWFAGTYLFTGSGNQVVADKPNSANVNEKKPLREETNPATGQEVAVSKTKDPAAANDKPVASGGDAAADNNFSENNLSLTPAAGEENQSVTANNRKASPGLAADNNRKPSSGLPANNNSKSSGALAAATQTDIPRSPNRNDAAREEKLHHPQPAKDNNEAYTINQRKQDDITVHDNNTNAVSYRPIEYSPLLENIQYTGTAEPKPGENVKKDLASINFPKKESRKSRSSRAGKAREERSFAIGLSLPLAFPLGDQKALSYNFNAGANAITDYIPSPHVQYRLNKRTYIQTELQFISPQYIRPILLYEQREQSGSNYMVYNSIYARKLYYFNLPVGIHYSPFTNFYLGSGLQFSSLLSGVGLYEETKRSMSGQPLSLISEHYAKLTGDSLSYRMNRTEVRLMLEANYYFNRFTIGLRYNQAFNNYVDFRLNNMSPYTFDKNKALQFYLRYNLWEDLRRKHSSKGMLSSK